MRTTIQTGGSFVYETDIKRVRRQGSTSPATGNPMEEALGDHITQQQVNKAVDLYCRHIRLFTAHRGAHSLPENTLTHELHKRKLLSEDMKNALELFYEDATKAAGKSGAQTGAYREAINTNSTPGRAVRAYTNKHYDRIHRLFHHLHRHQRGFMELLVKELHTGDASRIDLVMMGKGLSDYKGADQARALAAGHWQSFIKSVAEFYEADIRMTQKRVIQVKERTKFEPVKLEK